MRTPPFALAAVVLALSATPSLSGDTKRQGNSIPEDTVKIANAYAYSDLLLQAYRKGWRYTPSAIENGFRRHFEELKLQLLDQGYTIRPVTRIAVLGDVPWQGNVTKRSAIDSQIHFQQ
jgi:hypothetical protein